MTPLLLLLSFCIT